MPDQVGHDGEKRCPVGAGHDNLLDLRLILRADFAVGDVGELLGEHLAADGGDEVGEEDAVEVGELVLDHAGGELVEGLRLLLEVLVVVFHFDRFGTADVGVEAGDAQAALVELTHRLALLDHHRVDKRPAEALEVRINIRHDVAVDHGHTLAHADLGSGQAAALRAGERIPQVLHQGIQGSLVGEVGRSRDLAQDLRAV